MNKISILIIDDEALARKRIRRLIESEDDISIIGECFSGSDAVECIQEKSPDLIFLDVQMPELNGFEVLEKLNPDSLPIIIFVTAYDNYALKAFDVHAIDYLLKPFDDERFYLALQRARDQITSTKNDTIKQKLLNLLGDLKGSLTQSGNSDVTTLNQNHAYLDRICVKSAGSIYFVKTDEIERIKAAGKYLELKVKNQEHLIRQTMNQVESKLDPNQFLRIHRSTIINIDHIKKLQHWHKAQYAVILRNGEQLISSNSYRKNLERILNQFS